MTLGADDRRLSSVTEIGRSVRKNPKDSELGKLRAPQIVERETVLRDSGRIGSPMARELRSPGSEIAGKCTEEIELLPL
jgi:hypothetical protein